MNQESLKELWDVWSTRILVTIGIVLFFEFMHWQKNKDTEQQTARQTIDPSTPSSLKADVPLSTQQTKANERHEEENEPSPSSPNVVKDAKKSLVSSSSVSGNNRNRLLDQLEENQKHGQLKNEATKKEGDASREMEADEDEVSKGDTKSKRSKNEKRSKSTQSDSNGSSRSNTTTTVASTSTNAPTPIKAQTNQHPGMKHFNYWMDVECSLFRIYTLGRDDGVEVAPPYIPHSYRGNVDVALHVTNKTNTTLQVYWVDYKGKHVPKGKVKPNHVWTQTTWIDHPWVFEGEQLDGEYIPYLYYIPYRVIPTTEEISTVSDHDDEVGLMKFEIHPPLLNTPFLCSIQDGVMPFPAELKFYEPLPAITWTLQHMTRMMSHNTHLVDVLQKYLTNIVEHPNNTKYRQIRIASPKFSPIWQSPMRGLLLAIGFVEEGAYAELGCANFELSRERIQEVALLSYLVNNWKATQESATSNSGQQQPLGADGYGRAGFGRAGTMNSGDT